MKPSNIKAGIYTAVTAAALSTVTGLIPATAIAAPALPDMPQKLQGKTVFLDPGHQGPNHNVDVAKQVSDGRGGSKACQTTGMTTVHGIPEHTVNWNVAQLVRTSLEGLGAKVVLSRPDDTGWGGCIDERARAANESGADVALSIHADSAPAEQRGFHLIVPQLPIPDAKAHEVQSGAGLTASRAMRDAYVQAGFPAATYNNAVDGIQTRTDVAGPALTQVPDIFLEMGNGANAEDAQQLETPEGQLRHAVTITTGLVSYLLGLQVPPSETDAQAAAPGQPGAESEKAATAPGAPAAPAPQPNAQPQANGQAPAPAGDQATPQAQVEGAGQPQAAQPQAQAPAVPAAPQPQAAQPQPQQAEVQAQQAQPGAPQAAQPQPQAQQPAPALDARFPQPQGSGAPEAQFPQPQAQPGGQPGAQPQAAQPVVPAQGPAKEPNVGNAVLAFPSLSDIRPVSDPVEPQTNPGAAQPNAGAAIPNAGAAQPNTAGSPNAGAAQQNPAVAPQANQGPKGNPGAQSPSTTDTNPKSENADLQSMGTLVQLAVKFLNPLAKMLTGQNGVAADLVNLAYSVVSVLMSSAK